MLLSLYRCFQSWDDFDINGFLLHLDGSYSEMTPIDRSINDSWINSDFIVFDLNNKC